jgi:serine/threonine protein kinase
LGIYATANGDVVPYSLVGTPEYMPPELVRHCQKDDCTLTESVKPTYSMDMWSAGVVLFNMLGGYNPFHGITTKHIFRSIVHADLDLRAPAWQTVSASAKDLISKLLVRRILGKN